MSAPDQSISALALSASDASHRCPPRDRVAYRKALGCGRKAARRQSTRCPPNRPSVRPMVARDITTTTTTKIITFRKNIPAITNLPLAA